MGLCSLALLLALTPLPGIVDGSDPVASHEPAIEAALVKAGENRAELEAALAAVPEAQRPSMEHLIRYMPAGDLTSLDAAFLVEHVAWAHVAWELAPWAEDMDQEIFLDHVLPYASINERRDSWRKDFFQRFGPLVADAKTASEAAAILNNQVFPMVEVIYSTQRPKADQSPYESIEAGMASCTGLSVLLIDACRAVGVPARFVGTPLWSDGSGNHSWVEVWDDGWRVTGAAEPTGMELDKAWFLGRASTATPGQHGIYAVSFRPTPLRFPMVWKRDADEVWCVDVTDRYTRQPVEVPEGMARVRVRAQDLVADRSGRRPRLEVEVKLSLLGEGDEVHHVWTRDDRYDANDHAELLLPLGATYRVTARAAGRSGEQDFTVTEDEQLLSLDLNPLMPCGHEPAAGDEHDCCDAASTARVAAELWAARLEELRTERKAEVEALELTHGDVVMPFWYSVHGEAPQDDGGGRSLYISMHGGGGTAARVNDQQWENQKRLYSIDEGVYVAPRAPTDTWNLWHQGHIDPLFDRLITNMVALEGVDPDRVYLLGYSAGGDGVFQLAPRMADRFAAAAMMAGHPNETRPDGLRNLPFALHMGERDASYQRNAKAAEWKVMLAELRAADPEGYDHQVEIHAGKGHWMDRQDAMALPWMAARTRDLRPERLVWLQDDVTHERFYWLKVDAPAQGARVVVERDRQLIRIVEAEGVARLTIRLDDSMVDLDQFVRVEHEGRIVFEGFARRERAVLERTLAERDDPHGMFSAEVTVDLAAPTGG